MASMMRSVAGGRLRSGPTILVALIALLWAFSFGAVRDFVWADVRKGMISLDGMSRVTRGVIGLGFGLLLVMVGTLLFNDVWRAQSELFPLQREIPGRGMLLPMALAPITLFLVAVAWSFALAGALHAHWAIRLAALCLYVLDAFRWMTQGGLDNLTALLVGLGAIVTVPIFFLVRWRRSAHPALEFGVLLPLVGLTFALLQAQGVAALRLSGTPIVLANLSLSVQNLSSLVLPLLLRVGLNIVDFIQRAAGWTVAIVADRLPTWAPAVLLVLLFAWRLRDVVGEAAERVGGSSVQAEIVPFAWALGVPLIVGLVWFVVSWGVRAFGRRDSADHGREPSVDDVAAVVGRHALLLIVAWLAPQLAVFLVGYVVIGAAAAGVLLSSLGLQAGAAVQVGAQSLLQILLSTSVNFGWRLLVDGVVLALAAWAVRRGDRARALYFGLFGLLDLRSALSQPPGPLSGLSSVGAGNPVELWWVAVFALVAVVWLLRRELTRARIERLLFLLLATALLRQTDFISNPFSPFLGFAGVGFIAFGIIWDAVTVGSWANGASSALPRLSRVFLYLGYVLLTVVVVNWALTLHDIQYVGFYTGEIALGGLNVFGRPLLYAIFAVTLAAPAEDAGALIGAGAAPRSTSGGEASPSIGVH